MVAQRNQPTPEQKPSAHKRLVFLLLLIAAILLFFAIPKWEDVVKKGESGNYELQDWRLDERAIELDRNENAEQYRLLAQISRYYPCYLCKDKRIWINAGETLKIGITTNNTTRYTDAWLLKNDLTYFVDIEGNLATVRQAEIEKIANYPLWPENLKRPLSNRLVVPPLHKTVRLK
jgi:hypothetical protein